MILYTVNMIGMRSMTVFFPFIIIDLYWKDNPRGRLGWFLPVSLHLVSVNAIVQVALSKNIQLDNAYAVLLITLAAIGYYLLCAKIIPRKKVIIPPSEISLAIENIFKEHNLSERETEVALLMAREGLSNEEMGKRLFISTPTVKSHVSQIYRKFGVKQRAAFLAKLK